MQSYEPKAWLWFLSSYAPLWIMLGLHFECVWISLAFAALGLSCGGITAFLIMRGADTRPSNTTLTVTSDGGAEVSGYLASYLLPFLTVATPGPRDIAAFAIFIAIAGLIYVRSGLMQVNPVVYLLNRRVFKASLDLRGGGTAQVFVISRRNLRSGVSVKGERFSDRVYIDHRRDG